MNGHIDSASPRPSEPASPAATPDPATPDAPRVPLAQRPYSSTPHSPQQPPVPDGTRPNHAPTDQEPPGAGAGRGVLDRPVAERRAAPDTRPARNEASGPAGNHGRPVRRTTGRSPASETSAGAATGRGDDESETRVVLRGPVDLIDALPYLLGFHPQDGLVLIGMKGDEARFCARLRLPLPSDPTEWAPLAAKAADHVVNGGGPARRPDAVAICVLRDPGAGETPTDVMRRLRPLAQHVRRACGVLDVPVVEAVCVSGLRWWSYMCVTIGCCPPEGSPVPRPGTSVMAAAAAYAGVRIHGTLTELRSRLLAPPGAHHMAQRRAFDDASAELVPRMLLHGDTDTVREETLVLAYAAMERLRTAPAPDDPAEADRHDDAIIGDDEAATIVLGLQDRETRDRAAEWMEGEEAALAQRLWRALSRRCAGAYAGHAAAPLTLAGWVAWARGDEASARVALGMALEADPDYTFAQLLHRACNHGLDPDPLRRSLRRERVTRPVPSTRPPRTGGTGTAPGRRQGRTGAGTHPYGTRPGVPRARRRTHSADDGGGEPAAW